MPGPLANPFWRLLDEIGLPARDSISIAPAATLAALMRLLCYGAVFFLFLQVGRDGRRAHRCFAWIAGISAAYSRSEEHTSELQSLMRISYAVFCLKKKKNIHQYTYKNKQIED